MQKSTISKFVILVGIILVALNLRAAMTAPAPIFEQISKSFPISDTARGIVGMLPPISFALFGWLSPRFVPKIGLVRLILAALAMVFVGIIGRSLSLNIWMYAGFSILCLGGMGMCNVLLPPIIKQHFPNRLGLVTSIYTSLIYVSAGFPSLIAVPLTQAVGWRISTGSWAILALLAAVPWIFVKEVSQTAYLNQKNTHLPVSHWPIAWAIMIIFSIGAFNSFAMLAWLPEILTKSFGISQADSGQMMSMFSFIGFIPTLFVPIALTRFKKPIFVILFFSLSIAIANVGFLFLPEFALFWVMAAGIGLTFISIGLTLINLRSRTKDGSAALSGFVQGVGYSVGAFGPLVIGWMRGFTGSWVVPLWLLVGTGVLSLVMAVIALKPRYIEDFVN